MMWWGDYSFLGDLREFFPDVGPQKNYDVLDALEVQTNSIFNSRYRIICSLGDGGFGKVFSAERLFPDKKLVAIKVLELNGSEEKKYANRELDFLQNCVQNKHIATFYSSWCEDKSIVYNRDLKLNKCDKVFIELEYCNGNSLQHYMKTIAFKDIDFQTKIKIFRDMVEAVKYLRSQNYIHRDIKPGNILLKNIGSNSFEAKLGGYGLCRKCAPVDGKDMTNIGTPLYTSPEQVSCPHYDFSTDIYSLGFLLLEMLYPNFKRLMIINSIKDYELCFDLLDREVKLNEIYPKEIALIKQMTDKDPAKRPNASQIRNWIEETHQMGYYFRRG